VEAQVGPPGGEPLSRGENGGRAALMRINIWIVLGMLLALLAVARYVHHRGDTQRICVDDPTASVCHR
jgi:hypothetical protein